MNKVLLVGNIGKDPEIRTSQDKDGIKEVKIASFPIATSEIWRDKSTNEIREKTEWHRVVVFNERLIDVVEKYVRKGRKIAIEGHIQNRRWLDSSNAERNVTEVVLPRFRGELILLSSTDSMSMDKREHFHDEGSDEVPF
ncbi:single-stranded DNA-binding protein [Candidatus Fokinia solitaria]